MKLLYIVLFTIQLVYIDAESDPDDGLVEDLAKRPIDCNNPEVLAAVDITLRKFNAEQKVGHQYALYRVINAEVQGEQGKQDRRYSLEFSIRETDCPVGNEKLWKACNYSAPREASTGQCESNVHINKIKRITEVTTHNCSISPARHSWIVPKHAPCLGCAMDLPTNHSSLNETIDHALSKFNAESNYEHLFKAGTVFRITHQVVAGIKYELKFSIQEAECSKGDPDVILSECNVKPDGLTLFCNSTVYRMIWLNFTVLSLSCDTEPFHPVTFARGIVGWGPFSASELFTISESDETEDHPEKLTSAEEALADDLVPLTCPGKAWKSLRQIKPAAPPVQEHHEGNKPIQTTLGDTDLLDLAQ